MSTAFVKLVKNCTLRTCHSQAWSRIFLEVVQVVSAVGQQEAEGDF